VCAVRGYRAERAGGGPTGTGVNIKCKQAEAEVKRHSTPPAPPPARATVTRTPTQTHRAPNNKRRVRKRHSAAHLQAGDAVPECTVWPAATTGGVPANCAVQPSIPYASTTRSHTKSPSLETGELHAEIGFGRSRQQGVRMHTAPGPGLHWILSTLLWHLQLQARLCTFPTSEPAAARPALLPCWQVLLQAGGPGYTRGAVLLACKRSCIIVTRACIIILSPGLLRT